MELPTDLKDYRAPCAFQLFAQDVAGYTLAALIAFAFIADRLEWLAK